MPESKIVTTCSFWKDFRLCREKMNLRYNEELVPLETPEALRFGSLAHKALEVWDATRDSRKALEYLDSVFAAMAPGDHKELEMLLRLQAIVANYAKVYWDEDVRTLSLNGKPALEVKFEIPILNPETGSASRTFVLAGKIDRIVEYPQHPGECWILEKKTATTIDADYLERLWIDFQNHLYAHAARVMWNLNVIGVLYDVIQKPGLKLGEGESEEEYYVRRELLLLKSKTGKTTAKRQMREEPEAYHKRLDEWYADTEALKSDGIYRVRPDRFHRQRMEVTPVQIRKIQEELWDLTKQYLDSQARGYFAMNTDSCFRWNNPCVYWKACRSGKDEFVMKNYYKHSPRNEELLDASASKTTP